MQGVKILFSQITKSWFIRFYVLTDSWKEWDTIINVACRFFTPSKSEVLVLLSILHYITLHFTFDFKVSVFVKYYWPHFMKSLILLWWFALSSICAQAGHTCRQIGSICCPWPRVYLVTLFWPSVISHSSHVGDCPELSTAQKNTSDVATL